MADFDPSNAVPVAGTFDPSNAVPAASNSAESSIDKAHPLLQALDVGGRQAAADLLGAPSALGNFAHEATKHVLGKVFGVDTQDPGVSAMLDSFLPKTQYTPQYFTDKAQAAGLPMQVADPSSAAQRYIAATGRGVVSGAVGGPGQVAAGVASSVLPQVAQDLNAPPEVQAGASVLGAFAPGAGKLALKGALGVGKSAPANLAKMDAVGVQPTVGMVAGPGSNAQALENMNSNLMGGAGVTANAVNKANAAAAQNVSDIASSMGRVSDSTAGNAVKQALAGDPSAAQPTNYLMRLRAKVDDAYTARAAAVPATTTVDVAPVLAKIDEMSAQSPEFARWASDNATVQALREQAGKTSMPPGWQKVSIGGQDRYISPQGMAQPTPPPGVTSGTALPFQQADDLDRALSDQVDFGYAKGNTTSSVNGAISQVSQAMGKSVNDAIATVPGAPQLSARAAAIAKQAAAEKANISGITSAVTGENAMSALMSGNAKGGTILNSAMRGLSVPEQNMVSAGVIDHLGTAVPSVQGSAGGQWSANTFLTNWNKLHPDAKAALFRNMPDSYKQNLNAFADYAEQVKQSQALYTNPSGSAKLGVKYAQAATGIGGLTTAAQLAGHGHIGLATATAAGAVLTLGGPYLGAKLMTNPAVARWLAASTKVPLSSLPVIAGQLDKVAQQQNDPQVAALAKALQAPQPAQ